MVARVTISTADLRLFPSIVDRKNSDLTIGDLHANGLLLLYILIKYGFVGCSDKEKQAFKRLVDYYLSPDIQSNITPEGVKLAPIIQDKENETENEKENRSKRLITYRQQIYQCFADCQFIDTNSLIRIMGDDFFDRSWDDDVVVAAYTFLHDNNARFEILLSNHGLEFVEACERFKENNKFKIYHMPKNGQTNSAEMLIHKVAMGVVLAEEILDFYQGIYATHLKLLSYSLDEDEIQIFSHAAIGLQHIRGLAEKFSIPYPENHPDKAEELACIIDEINAAFSDFARSGKIHTLYTDKAFHDADKNWVNDMDSIILSVIWNRNYDGLIREIPGKKYKIKFVHGHDSNDPSSVHVTLNSMLGQFKKFTGDLTCYLSTGITQYIPKFIEQIIAVCKSNNGDEKSLAKEIANILRPDRATCVNFLQAQMNTLRMNNNKMTLAFRNKIKVFKNKNSELEKLIIDQTIEMAQLREELAEQEQLFVKAITKLEQRNENKEKLNQELNHNNQLLQERIVEFEKLEEAKCQQMNQQLLLLTNDYLLKLSKDALKLIPNFSQDMSNELPAVCLTKKAEQLAYNSLRNKYNQVFTQLKLTLISTTTSEKQKAHIFFNYLSDQSLKQSLAVHRDPAWQRYLLQTLLTVGLMISGILPSFMGRKLYGYISQKKNPLFFNQTEGERFINESLHYYREPVGLNT